MAGLLERIIQTPMRLVGLIITVAFTAVIIGLFLPALYGALAGAVVFVFVFIVDAIIHPSLLKIYIFVIVALAVAAVWSGYDPFAERDDDFGPPVLRGRELLPINYVRREANRNLQRRHAASRARRRTL